MPKVPIRIISAKAKKIKVRTLTEMTPLETTTYKATMIGTGARLEMLIGDIEIIIKMVCMWHNIIKTLMLVVLELRRYSIDY